MQKGLGRQALETVSALAVVIPVWNWAEHYAYEFRGYHAAGGEYIFILAVYLAAYRVAGQFFELLESQVAKKRMKCKSVSRKGTIYKIRWDRIVCGKSGMHKKTCQNKIIRWKDIEEKERRKNNK